MSQNKKMLDAIQKAGAAVFEADAQLKLAAKSFGERVHTSVSSNPYHLGNDALFENWKLVARLSQTTTAMEKELRKVYQVASDLSDDEPSAATTIPALPAPEFSGKRAVDEVTVLVDQSEALAATDVKVKKASKDNGSKNAATELPPNAATLLKHLGAVMNNKEFTRVNQTQASQATGIAMGSMTASLKRLVAGGHLLAGATGQYKLVK
jgi:hypothetical protein